MSATDGRWVATQGIDVLRMSLDNMDPRDFTPHLRLNLPPAQSCQSVNEKFGTFSFRLG